VLVSGRNTGTTTWQRPAYALSLGRNGRILTEVPSVDIPFPVAPGKSVTFAFNVRGDTTAGLGGVITRMTGPQGAFGEEIGLNIRSV
jgi:hypothetical protein